MDKIILQIHRVRESRVGEAVKISREAAEAIEALQLETGLSIKAIASALIVQAARFVEIQEVPEGKG